MKLLRKVKSIEAKKAFVMTHIMRKLGIARKHDKKTPTKALFIQTLNKAHKVINKLSEKQLDRNIGKYKKRLHSYNRVEWYIGEVSTKEVGVWKMAGGLPRSWTDHSLASTALLVKKALKKNDGSMHERAGRVIPIIIGLKSIIKKDKYSLPIIIQRNSSPVNRRGLEKMPLEIDDGNMRSIAFAVNGDKKLKAYIGITK